MKKILSILFVVALVVGLGLVAAAPVLAATIRYVPSVYLTIQAAVNASSDGDTIMVAAGNYSAFLVQNKTNISIIGAEGATVTTGNNFSPAEEVWVWVAMAAVYDSTNINIEGIDFNGAGVSGQHVVGIAYADSTGRIADLTVENLIGTEYGVGVAVMGYSSASIVDLSGTTVRGSMIGVFSDWGGSILQAHFNNIAGNTQFGAVNYGNATLDATRNWWGDASGPSGYGPGVGDAVSDDVDYVPWLGAGTITQTVTNGTLDAKVEADTEVLVNGNATVTVSKYLANPSGNASAGFIALGKYIDVHVPDTGAATQIEIRLYYTNDEVAGAYENYIRLLWWNGTAWAQCSDSGVNTADIDGYSGYMWAKIRADTTPSLSDLNGDEFGGYGHPPTPGGCFVATAAYGTDTAKQLDILREFRDTVLLPNSLGAKFVSFYYKTSPPIANFISQHEVLRAVVRVGFVDPIVKILTWTHDLWSARGS